MPYGSADCTHLPDVTHTHVEMYHVGLQCLRVSCPYKCVYAMLANWLAPEECIVVGTNQGFM